MHYWRDTYFQSLKDIASEAIKTPEWADYAAYCTERERGLRRQAFVVLARFLSRLERASFTERRRFVSWLMHRADGWKGEHMLVPHPLRTRIVEPTLVEWAKVEPNDSEPHRWMGGYDHLKEAIRLNPTDEIARRKFIFCILGSVEYATHELPAGYLGHANDDLAALDEAQTALTELPGEDERMRIAALITEERDLINEYLRRRSPK